MVHVISLFLSILVGAAIGFSLKLEYNHVWLVAAVILCIGVVWQSLRLAKQWLPWSSQQYVADFVERKIPALQERSYLALDQHPTPSFLRERALESVAKTLQSVSVRGLISAQPLKNAGKGLLMMVLVFSLAEWRLPITPTAALRSLQSQSQYALEQAKDAVIEEEASVTIGDIVIEYTFPAYTNMTPVTIPNSNGEIHAPQGTTVKIRAKTLERFESVVLELNGEIEPATLDFGREITATFDLKTEGSYRFLLLDGEKQIPSQSFPVVFDADDPPVVSLEIKQTQIPSNRSIPITWTASDDFGLERVILEISHNGNTKEIMLRKPNQNRLKLGAKIRRSVEELGLKGGDTATLKVIAYDNQAPITDTPVPRVEGEAFGKRGESAPIEIQILTPQMSAEKMKELNQKLRDALVLIIADYLVEDIPTEASILQWSFAAAKRYDQLRHLTDEAWGEGWPTYLSAELIAKVYADSASMFRFVRTTYAEDGVGQPKSEDMLFFQESYTDHISQLEQTIYIIDRMLRQVAFRDVEKASKDLTRSAERFASMDMKVQSAEALLNALSKVEKDLQQIAESVTELGGYSIQEFVEQRSIEIERMKAEIRSEIAQENLSEASEHTSQMSQSVTQFAEGVSEMLERMKAKEDELDQEMESLIEKLEELDEKQQAALQEMQQARTDDPTAQEMASLWQQIEAQSQIAFDSSRAMVEGVGDGRGFRYGSIRAIERLASDMGDLHHAVITRNIEGVSETISYSGIRLKRVENVIDNERLRGRTSEDPLPKTLPNIQTSSNQVTSALVKIQQLLNSDVLANAQSNPYLMEQAQKMESTQAQLQQEMQSLIPKVQEVEQQMPTATGKATDFAMQASKSMEDARGFLGEGDHMGGESLQFQSSARIQDTIEALKQASSQMQQMQQQMEQMAGGGEQDGEMMSSDVEIPRSEPRVSPEEYRKMLLQGMQGGVPEEYETLKKKYYEELVAQ